MQKFSVTIAADVRGYAVVMIDAETIGDAIDKAEAMASDYTDCPTMLPFRFRYGEIKGDVSILAAPEGESAGDEWHDVPTWGGMPRYADLLAERDRLKAYIESVARITETFQRAFAIGRATQHSVCVQTIDRRDGTLVSAFTTEEAARADLAKWCRDNWHLETDHSELDDDETIETYFDGNDEDFYAIDRIMVEG